MILLESRDLSLSLFLSFLPLTFWLWEEFDIHYRELPRGLMLAGQLETFPGTDDSWIGKSWMAVSISSSSLMPKLFL